MPLYKSINRNNRFRQIYNKGKSAVDASVVIYYMKNRGYGLRVGITASKKIGGAVQRNRAKRVIRAAIMNVARRYCLENVDIILVARIKTVSVKSTQVEKALVFHLKKLGLIDESLQAQAAPKIKK